MWLVGWLVFTLSYCHSGERQCLLTKVAAALREAWEILFAERESKSVRVCGLGNDARGKGCRGKRQEPAALWTLGRPRSAPLTFTFHWPSPLPHPVFGTERSLRRPRRLSPWQTQCAEGAWVTEQAQFLRFPIPREISEVITGEF